MADSEQKKKLWEQLNKTWPDSLPIGKRAEVIGNLKKALIPLTKLNIDSIELLEKVFAQFDAITDLNDDVKSKLCVSKALFIYLKEKKRKLELPSGLNALFKLESENYISQVCNLLLEGAKYASLGYGYEREFLNLVNFYFEKPSKNIEEKCLYWQISHYLFSQSSRIKATLTKPVGVCRVPVTHHIFLTIEKYREAKDSFFSDIEGLSEESCCNILLILNSEEDIPFQKKLVRTLENAWSRELDKKERGEPYLLDQQTRFALDIYTLENGKETDLNPLLEKFPEQLNVRQYSIEQFEKLKALLEALEDSFFQTGAIRAIDELLIAKKTANSLEENLEKLILDADHNLKEVEKFISNLEHSIAEDYSTFAHWFTIAKGSLDQDNKIPGSAFFRSFPELHIMLSRITKKNEERLQLESYARQLFERLLERFELNTYDETELTDSQSEIKKKFFYRSDIFWIVGNLAYQGIAFSKNHSFARLLFKTAVDTEITLAKPMLARMYFYAEGGPLEFSTAVTLMNEVTRELPDFREAWWLELKADYFFIQYLQAQDFDKTAMEENLKLCIDTLIALENMSSLKYLWMLVKHEHAADAALALDSLYQKYPDIFSGFHDFMGLTADSSTDIDYRYEFCLHAYNFSKNDLDKIPENYRDEFTRRNRIISERDSASSDLLGKYQRDIKPFFKEPALFSTELNLKQKFNELALGLRTEDKKTALGRMILAVDQLFNKENTVLVRRFDFLKEMPESEQLAVSEFLENLLLQYYQQSCVADAKNKLLTIVCYEATHVGEESNEYRIMRKVLNRYNEEYESKTIRELQDSLKSVEASSGDYYDECSSDDSDAEDDKTYQGSNHFLTSDVARRRDLFGGIKKTLLKHLVVVRDSDIDEKKPEEAEEKRKRIWQGFHKKMSQSARYENQSRPFRVGIPHRDFPSIVHDDLAKLNHAKSQGKMNAALATEIRTSFVVAQVRGVHSFLNHWGADERRKMRRRIYEETHPIHGKPIYSHAVYQRAGISNYSDLSDATYFRLEKVALHVYCQVMSLGSEKTPAHDAGEIAWLDKTTAPCSTLLLQMQQLYSENHGRFHEKFLPWAKEHRKFSLTANPCLSFGDIESEHGPQYAFGEKVYAGSEDKRLRPKYKKDGRPLRPYSGYMLLALCPLEDYVRGDSHHVFSMVRDASILVRQEVVPERENTFMVKLGDNRMIFMVSAKFPSFHHGFYPKTFAHKYGITEDVYFLCKELIATTKPHSPRRRLLIDFLGTYLSAYNQMYLMRYAYEQSTLKYLDSESGGPVLLYRDAVGNFSLRSTMDTNPTPSGLSESSQLTRFSMFTKRKDARKASRASRSEPAVYAETGAAAGTGSSSMPQGMLAKHGSEISAEAASSGQRLASAAVGGKSDSGGVNGENSANKRLCM